jgi:hypothetical protein
MERSRSAISRSDFGISAIFASTSFPRRATSARRVSLIAAFSSAVSPLDVLRVAVVLVAGFLSGIAKHLLAPNDSEPCGLPPEPVRVVKGPASLPIMIRCDPVRSRETPASLASADLWRPEHEALAASSRSHRAGDHDSHDVLADRINGITGGRAVHAYASAGDVSPPHSHRCPRSPHPHCHDSDARERFAAEA